MSYDGPNDTGSFNNTLVQALFIVLSFSDQTECMKCIVVE